MAKFDNEWYKKGYDDGFSDAINNPDIENIIEQIENLSKEEKRFIKLFINKDK